MSRGAVRRFAFTSGALIESQTVEKTEHVADMEERFPVPGFGVSQVNDTDKLSRCAIVSQKLIQMGMFKAGVRAGLPIRRDRRVAIRVIPSGPDLFNVHCGHLLFHELCSTGFRIWGHSFECAICLRSMCSGRRSALPALTRNGGKCWRKWPAQRVRDRAAWPEG